MIILLYGSNSYLLKRKLKEIIDLYQQKNKGMNLSRIDAESFVFADFWHDFQQKSMFVSRRLIIIDNIFQGDDFKKQFKRELKTLMADEDVLVAWSTARPKKEDRVLIEKIKESGRVQEFPQPKRSDTRRWLEGLNQDQAINLSPEDLEKLVEYVQDDWVKGQRAVSRLLVAPDHSSEIKKLGQMSEQMEEINVFSLTEAIAYGFKSKALGMTHRYFSRGGRPEKLLPIIVYQFRQLLMIRDLVERGCDYHQVRRRAKVPPFAFSRVYRQAETTDLGRLKEIYDQLFELDYQLKTGQVDPRTGFDLFIARV